MAKKKSGFGLDLGLFSLICAGLGVVALVIFFSSPFTTITVLEKAQNWSFLKVAMGTKESLGSISITTLEGNFLVWILMVLPIAIAGVSLFVKGKLKWIINVLCGVLGIVFVLVCAQMFASTDTAILLTGDKATLFGVLSVTAWISMVLYLGVAAVSGYKLVK